VSIRVVIVDDQAMVRTGLASIIDGEPDLEVVALAADGVQGSPRLRAPRQMSR